MTKTLFADSAALMSPRTAKYIEALTREGDSFDYNKWLKKVREEEAQAKQVPTGITPHDVVDAQVDNPIKTSDGQHARPNPALPLVLETIWVPRPLRPHRQSKSQTPKARLRRWLEKVRRACEQFQANRRRDSVYEFLAPVFDIVMHYKVRRRTTKLLRHAFEFANLQFDKNVDPFSAVIRCTCGDGADRKTISKYARALMYVDKYKKPRTSLQRFMKAAGGINGCAALCARMRNGKADKN
jgi:hypothetical protein